MACGNGLRPKPLVEEANVINGGVSYLCGSNKTAIRGGNDKAPFRVPLVLADDATGGLQQSLSLGCFPRSRRQLLTVESSREISAGAQIKTVWAASTLALK